MDGKKAVDGNSDFGQDEFKSIEANWTLESDASKIVEYKRQFNELLKDSWAGQEKTDGAREVLEEISGGYLEAVANAIKHGNRGNPDLAVLVAIALERDCLTIKVLDQGPGFRFENAFHAVSDSPLANHGRGFEVMQYGFNEVSVQEFPCQITLIRRRGAEIDPENLRPVEVIKSLGR